MKNFLCPTDFSEAANNAVEYAAILTKRLGAELTLLHILHNPVMQDVANISAGFLPTTAERMKEAQEKMDKYCDIMEKKFNTTFFRLVKSYTSSIESGIKKEIEEGDYDLVIMGTNGADDLYQFYFGTHTYSVIRKTLCPLLMIPVTSGFKGLSHIVYATDYKKEDVKNIKKVMNLTSKFNPQVTILHITENSGTVNREAYRSFKNQMEDQLNSSTIHFQKILEEDIASGIDRYVDKNDVDMLVLLTHHHSFFERIFKESITKNMSYIATYPVLINYETT